MKKAKLLTSILLASILLLTQVFVAFAAPQHEISPIAGTVQAVTLETDPNTGITTVLVEIKSEDGKNQTVRISLETAGSPDLGLVTLNDNGNPIIVEPLPGHIQIDPAIIISVGKQQNPVASAITTFFSNIPELDYDAVMDAHSSGNGFGLIVQALLLTEKLGGNAAMFREILQAKKDNDYSNFPLDDGTIPTSWGQLKKAIAEKLLGAVMSHNQGNNSDNSNSGSGNGNSGNNSNNGNSNKDKNKDKPNNGNGKPNKP
jgi:hypothetical protein